jgi:5-methylcytosine-specific restriction endonuclease McrA
MSAAEKQAKGARLHHLQHGRCAFCADPVANPYEFEGRRPGMPRPDAPTLEHVVLRSKGGSNALTNLLLAHFRCNAERADGDLPEAARAVWKNNLEILRRIGLAA